MICITVTESDGEYISVESNGHAGYAEEGQDIICAAVSALIVNTVNSVETLTEDLIISEAGDGYVYTCIFHSRMGILKVPHFL